ncbi:MAG: helix-turn-helix domain-containing protein [Candidatus Nitrosocaldaceae archaeon]
MINVLVSLDLSVNEAKAYIALLSNGPQNISALAHKASIPRSKAYSVIRRLIKKEMVDTISSKPLVVVAIHPEYALERFVKHHQQLANDVREIIKELEEVMNDKIRNKTYMIIDRSSEYIHNLINNARYSLLLMFDAQNLNITERYKDEIILAYRNGIEVKILANINSLIDGIEIKRYEGSNNMLIIDDTLVLFDGLEKYYVFNDKEFVKMYMRIFYNMWNNSIIQFNTSSRNG